MEVEELVYQRYQHYLATHEEPISDDHSAYPTLWLEKSIGTS